MLRSRGGHLRPVALCDVHRRTDYFNDIIGKHSLPGVQPHGCTWPRRLAEEPIVDLEVAPAPNGLVDQGLLEHVLRVQPLATIGFFCQTARPSTSMWLDTR